MNHQPGLFDAPRARTTDPLSSHAAADQAEASGLIGWQMQRVLEAIRATPGMTSAELAARHGLDRHMCGRRLPDLERKGLVRRIEWGAKQVRWEAITAASCRIQEDTMAQKEQPTPKPTPKPPPR